MTEKLYPALNDDPHTFRLNRINEIENTFRRDIEERKSVRKKYDRIITATEGVDACLIAGGVAMAGLGFAIPLILPIQIVAIVTGSAGLVLKVGRKFLARKSNKHTKIITAAESKLNSIQDVVSKALEDGKISDEEFAQVSHELTKYREMKRTIRKQDREEKRNTKNDALFTDQLDTLLKNWKENQPSK